MSGSVTVWRGRRPRLATVGVVCSVLVFAAQTAGWAARAITRVDIRPGAGKTVLALFTADEQRLEATSFSLQDPPRLVFDFPGATLDPDLPLEIPVVAPALRAIRLGQFSVEPDIARLVVDLSEQRLPPSWEITAGVEPGETLIVLRQPGPVLLAPPNTEIVHGVSVVRIPGVAQLRRSTATLTDPPRVYADLTDAVLEEGYREEFSAGAIREIRMAQQPADPEHPIARIVLELREEQAHIVFADGPDLILAVGPQPWALPLARHQADNRLEGKRIVIDPGHGGDDIGAPAKFGSPPGGPFEKDLVLEIGHRLAKLLKAEGAQVSMTREDDTYIGLTERAALANHQKAHALISIHCNSCDTPNTLQGTSVYWDHQHSRGFAQLVQRELIAALATDDKGVRNANFAVIRRAKGPGILVETAYINHDGDRARLVHPNFQERAARAILQGLISFLSAEHHGVESGQ